MVGEEPTYIVALVGVVGTISGAIIGFGLNWVKESRDKNNTKESVRLLISLEIDKNIEMLTQLWDHINERELNGEIEHINSVKGRMLLYMPSVHWSDESLKSLITYLPTTFTKDEIRNIQDFYGDIEHIKSIRSYLESSAEENSRYRQSLFGKKDFQSVIQKGLNPAIFNSVASNSWKKFEKIAVKLLKNGNPLN